jgi:hypothetical protein
MKPAPAMWHISQLSQPASWSRRLMILRHRLMARHDLGLGRLLVLRMPAQRHGQARHGLHGQAERGEQQQEAGEAGHSWQEAYAAPGCHASRRGAVFALTLPLPAAGSWPPASAALAAAPGAWRANSML